MKESIKCCLISMGIGLGIGMYIGATNKKVQQLTRKAEDMVQEKIEDAKIEFKRNLEKINVEYDFEVLQDSSNKSYTSGEIGDLITYFQSRYEKLSKI